jgi:hypothetical protein
MQEQKVLFDFLNCFNKKNQSKNSFFCFSKQETGKKEKVETKIDRYPKPTV